MKKTRRSQRRCPQCGWAIARIPRRPEDRIASQTPPVRRYRCCEPGGCGWEGTLVATWARTRIERRLNPKLARVGMPPSRFFAWALLGLTLALLAGSAKLYATFAPMSLARNDHAIPFGVSDFGRPLPEHHPFLQQHVAPETHALKTAVAATGSSTTATPAASSDDAPLSLREDCAWGEPGRNPYKGTVQQALKAARLPAEVVALLERRIQGRDANDRLEIRNDKIRGVHSDAAFEPRAIKLTYGKTLCLNSRVNFHPGHVEHADLYEVADARGITYSVMVPDVCGNVAVLGPRAGRGDRTQRIPASKTGQPYGAQSVQPLVRIPGATTPLYVNSVPEPGTWTMLIGGLALVGWLSRRHQTRAPPPGPRAAK